ncbi:hypothetical protein RJ639_030941 [Escallonia herrerae]|uniref:ELK domain-containing protein n=1 Tax=Escallonia herrerae TaxID=1293975 RepID=A0AA89BMI8_9ASTE|nr:hypothetical protein RJ639_030941 [Escallonia herrerae]
MDNQGGGGACMMMGYGDSHTTNIGTASSNGQLLCPTMLMMMPPTLPPITSSHSHPISDQHNYNHNDNNSNNNTLFLPLSLPPPPTTNNTTNTTGCYFMMDSQNNHHHHNSSVNGSGGSNSSTFSPSSVVKAKIMSHPLYHRLLSAYANCQKFTSSAACGEALDRNGSSEEEVDVNNNLIDPQAEDRELKGQLLRKYSGYLGSLKQEFMKKRKKGKLPKEARQQLLDWWSRHYKWPYPSVSVGPSFRDISERPYIVRASCIAPLVIPQELFNSCTLISLLETETYVWTLKLLEMMQLLSTGIAETGTGRINGSGSEADKQLVHQPKEAALEALRGHAVCGDGCSTSPLLRRQRLGKSFSHGHLARSPLRIR